MRLRLDHLIIRTAEPGRTLAELARRAGAPVLAEVEELVGSIESGIARAGPVDLEVLKIGAIPPERPLGYRLGFVADVPLMEALGELGAAGDRAAWERLPLGDEVPVTVRDDGPAGITRVLLTGARRKPFSLGAVRFEWVSA